MALLISCDGYRIIREVPSDADLPKLCREEEEYRNDGYAVIACSQGRILADAAGYSEPDGPSETGLALERTRDGYGL